MDSLKVSYKKEKELSKKIDILGQIIDEANDKKSLQDLDFGIGHIEKFLEKKYRQLNSEDIAVLTTNQIVALTTDQINPGLSTDQVAALTTTQIAALTTAQVAAMSTDQIAALNFA